MEPTLRVGDFIVLTGASCQSVNVGDIVVYVARNPTWAGLSTGIRRRGTVGCVVPRAEGV